MSGICRRHFFGRSCGQSTAPAAAQDWESMRSREAELASPYTCHIDVDRPVSTGTIKVYRQNHTVPGIDPATREGIGDYQAAIARKLMHDRPQHVFDERCGDLEPGAPGRAEAERKCAEVFPCGIPAELNPHQNKVLAEVGAAVVYALLNPTVAVHAYTRPEEQKQVDKQVHRSMQAPGAREFIMDKREQMAMGNVRRFMHQHPEVKEVALIFGADHRWGPEDFPAGDSGCRVVSYHWPRLDERLPHRISGRLAGASPTDQERIVAESRALEPAAFAVLRTEAVQRTALSKLRPDPRDYSRVEHLKLKLLDSARTPLVKAEIEQMFREHRGPFAYFYADFHSPCLKAAQSGEKKDIRQAIAREPSIATQSEIVRQAGTISLESYEAIDSYRARMIALDKVDAASIVRPDGTPLTKQELRTYLLSCSPPFAFSEHLSWTKQSDIRELNAQIWSRFAEGRPPFAGLPSGPEIPQPGMELPPSSAPTAPPPPLPARQ